MNEERYEEIKRMVIKNEELEQNALIQYLLESIDNMANRQLTQVAFLVIEIIGLLLVIIWKLL